MDTLVLRRKETIARVGLDSKARTIEKANLFLKKNGTRFLSLRRKRRIEIDNRWENLKHVRSAGWKGPADHPDIDPPHEALQLAEHYREAGRLEKTVKSSDEFRRWLTDAEQGAKELEVALRKGKAKAVDRPVRWTPFLGQKKAIP